MRSTHCRQQAAAGAVLDREAFIFDYDTSSECCAGDGGGSLLSFTTGDTATGKHIVEATQLFSITVFLRVHILPHLLLHESRVHSQEIPRARGYPDDRSVRCCLLYHR
jgi:hypothetical protein